MTGSVFPDISREIPVISLANGRVVDIKARLDDNVKKGQLLFNVQSPDITNAFDVYLKAVNDEQMANKAYIRAKDLYQHGAISQAMLEQAEDAEKDAKADLTAAEEQLKILGVDKEHPSPMCERVCAHLRRHRRAERDQRRRRGRQRSRARPRPLPSPTSARCGFSAMCTRTTCPRFISARRRRSSSTAYPDKLLTGRVSDIGPVLDPTIRTAKVRIEVANPGILRLGMFVTATLLSRTTVTHAVVPASAILHLHDREWVFVPAGQEAIQARAVEGGDMLPGRQQEILSGMTPGQQVVKDVLNLQATVEAQ